MKPALKIRCAVSFLILLLASSLAIAETTFFDQDDAFIMGNSEETSQDTSISGAISNFFKSFSERNRCTSNEIYANGKCVNRNSPKEKTISDDLPKNDIQEIQTENDSDIEMYNIEENRKEDVEKKRNHIFSNVWHLMILIIIIFIIGFIILKRKKTEYYFR